MTLHQVSILLANKNHQNDTMAAQLPDIIFIQGEQMELYSNPLEQYWVSHPGKRPKFQPAIICKRGYVATWEIRDKQLFLTHIEAHVEKSYFLFWRRIAPFALREIFKNVGPQGIVAEWFSGKIRIPQGRRTLYVHHAYDSRFEREMIITLDHGRVVKTVVLDYTHQKLAKVE